MATSPAAHRPLPTPLAWFNPRLLGPVSIFVLVVAQAILWTVGRPSGEPAGSFIGQLFGAEAVLLMSIGLVLISALPWVEPWFDGIDRAAIWHRRVMITGLVLLLPHILLSSNPSPSTTGPALGVVGVVGLIVLAGWAILPRWQSVVPAPFRGAIATARDWRVVRMTHKVFGGYERWRLLHRTTGLFVAAGFLHGLFDGTAFDSQVLRWSYVVMGGIGLAFYAYRELLAGYFLPLHDYEVDAVRPIGSDLVEISLKPLGRRFEFVPGQFALLYLEGKDGWHRHPFTIASAPHEHHVRVTVKALGDFTASIDQLVEPGMPAVLGGAHGRFDHRRGTGHQVWVAGGVGVAPFLSWLRSAEVVGLPERVDFFYSSVGPAAFGDEIRAIAERHDSVRVHFVDTNVEGRLTPQQILATAGSEPRELTVFMCGPAKMLKSFQSALPGAGVRPSRIHREFFDLR